MTLSLPASAWTSLGDAAAAALGDKRGLMKIDIQIRSIQQAVRRFIDQLLVRW
jgi:hypothetical protein